MSTIRFAVAILMFTCQLFGQDTNPSLDEEKLQQLLPLDLWYNLDLEGQPAGYMMMQITPATYADQPAYQHEQNIVFQMTQDGITLDVIQSTTLYYAGRAPYQLLQYENEERIEGLGQVLQQTKQVYTCQDGDCQLAIDEEQAKPITPIAYTLADPLGQYLWLAADDRGLGDRLAFQILDEATAEASEVILEVTGVKTDQENGRQLKTRVAMPDMTIESIWDDTPQMISADMGFLAVTLSDEETARAYGSTAQPSEPSEPEVEPAEAGNAIALPTSNPDMPAPIYRFYEWTTSPETFIDLPTTPRQTFSVMLLEADTGLVITAWSTGQDGLPVTEDEVANVLSRSLSGQSDRAELEAQLAAISSDSPTGTQIFNATLSQDNPDVTQAITRFLDLCHLAKIPARAVTGLRYNLDTASFTPYVYTEFAQNEIWLPVDPAGSALHISPLIIRIGHEPDAMTRALQLAATDIQWVDNVTEAQADPPPNVIGDFGVSVDIDSEWQLKGVEEQGKIKKFVNNRGDILSIEEMTRYMPTEADQRAFFSLLEETSATPEMVKQYENMLPNAEPRVYRSGYCYQREQTDVCWDMQLICYDSLHYIINTTKFNSDAESTRQLADYARNRLTLTQAARDAEDFEMVLSYSHLQKKLEITYPEHVLQVLSEGDYVFGLADPFNTAVFYGFWDLNEDDLNTLKDQVKTALSQELGPLTEEKSLERTVSGRPALQTTWQIPNHQAQVTSILLLLPDNQYVEFRYLVTPGGASYQNLFREMVDYIKITLGPETEETTDP